MLASAKALVSSFGLYDPDEGGVDDGEDVFEDDEELQDDEDVVVVVAVEEVLDKGDVEGLEGVEVIVEVLALLLPEELTVESWS